VSSVIDEVPRPSEKSGFGFFESSTTRSLIGGLSVAAAWSMVAVLTALWPDKPESDWAYTGGFAIACGALALALALAAFAGVRFVAFQRLQRLSPWLFALALFFAAWEAVTAKLGLLPLPFFPPPLPLIYCATMHWSSVRMPSFGSS